jgi:hypothetical protein
MRSEARTAYRLARSHFFNDADLDRTAKLRAASMLRSDLPGFTAQGRIPSEVARIAINEIRQKLQIEQSQERLVNGEYKC